MSSARHLALSATSAFATIVTSQSRVLCDGGKPLVRRDKDGNIQVGATFSQFSNKAFWDSVAAQAGQGVTNAIETGIPTQLSYGFISGYCSGLALKKAGKVAATVFGLGFVCLQTLSYQGYVQVDHIKLRKDVESMLDLNKDGKVDGEDTQIASTKLLEILQVNMPGGSGFAAGFVGGIRSG